LGIAVIIYVIIIGIISVNKDKFNRDLLSSVFAGTNSFGGGVVSRASGLNPTNYLIFSRQDLDELLKKKINLIPCIDFVMLNKNIELYKGIKLERTDKKTSYNFKKLLILSVNIFVNYNIVTRYLNNNQ
jgi:hypothetical protein